MRDEKGTREVGIRGCERTRRGARSTAHLKLPTSSECGRGRKREGVSFRKKRNIRDGLRHDAEQEGSDQRKRPVQGERVDARWVGGRGRARTRDRSGLKAQTGWLQDQKDLSCSEKGRGQLDGSSRELDEQLASGGGTGLRDDDGGCGLTVVVAATRGLDQDGCTDGGRGGGGEEMKGRTKPPCDLPGCARPCP